MQNDIEVVELLASLIELKRRYFCMNFAHFEQANIHDPLVSIKERIEVFELGDGI
jgi:hypothetical protein